MPGGQEGLSGPQGLQHPHPSSDPLCCHWGGGSPPLLGGFSGTQTQHRGTPKGLKVVQMSDTEVRASVHVTAERSQCEQAWGGRRAVQLRANQLGGLAWGTCLSLSHQVSPAGQGQ